MTKLGKRSAAFVALVASSASPLPASGTMLLCPDRDIAVTSTSPESAALACNFAMQAKKRIVACGLDQSRPIQVFIEDWIEHDFADCLATYNCSDDVIRVTDPVSLSDRLEEEDSYRVLPVTVLFQALISHEMAHALLEQSSPGTDLAFVDHEYVAAAMELDILDQEWREALIDAAPVSLPPKAELISALIYAIDPRKFATNAWRFFNADPDGCERIRRIAAGDFSFSRQPP